MDAYSSAVMTVVLYFTDPVSHFVINATAVVLSGVWGVAIWS